MNQHSGDVVEHWRHVVAGHPAGDQRRAVAQAELGAALLGRYRVVQGQEDLIEAIAVLETAIRALADTPLAMGLNTTEGVGAVLTFADALLARARAGGGPRDLEIAEQYLQFAEDVSTDRALSALLMLKTCQVYQGKHEFDGSVDTLYKATAYANLAKHGISEESRVDLHRVHAQALLDAYRLTGVEDYVDEAMELLSSVTATGANHDQIVVLMARCLLAKAEGTTHTTDIERAVELLRQHTPQTNGPWFVAGQTLLTLFERTGRGDLLNQAWQSFFAALHSVPEQHPDHQSALGQLSAVAMKAHQRTGELEPLETAVGLQRRALALSAQSHTDHVRHLHARHLDQLGYSLRKLYDTTQEPAYLEEAITLFRSAIGALPPRDPQRVATGLSLAQALRATYLRTGDSACLTEAAQSAVDAGRTETGAVPTRIDAFDKAGHTLVTLGQWATATDAFGDAIALLPRLASRGRTRHDQYADLSSTAGLAASAASCAMSAGQPERALELLERGRGVLLNQRLTPGGELAALQRADESLAADFQRMRRDFEAPAPDPDLPRPTTFGRDRETEWMVLLDTIRAVPGLSNFLRPPSARRLLDQLGETVVIPIPSEMRCDALILRDHRAEVLSLPGLALTDAMANLRLLQEATTAAHDPAVDARGRMRAQSVLTDVLDWLWRSVVGPVLDRLAAPGTAGRLPRVWWCPVGPLAFFPLHAAQSSTGESALDRVLSSYTPTVTALARVRNRPRASQARARSCVVAMRHTPGAPGALPATEREAALAAEALPDAWTGMDEMATRDQVLERLAGSVYAHFACHAVADPQDPAMGRLLIHDHQDNPLTVADVSGLDLDAELGFLSACATSRAPLNLIDESLHITGAFQLAGFRHVIGTLWETDDAISLELATAFYNSGNPGDSAAYALHSAVRGLRDRYPHAPTLWAAHIHSGG
ncbi:CHAT domain-containing protein [Saccharomonospora piscinae]|uniref:CHAT domain-containing protein n=1 Tax=Saccharomonospora piscinae TaxID=687388 RepID=UPI0004BC7AD2|nr:CHAT domain-containing protein [Saccharomonospora piscinae]